MNVKKTVFVLATLAGLVQGLAEPKCDLRGGAAEGTDAAICNGRVNGVRIETLSIWRGQTPRNPCFSGHRRGLSPRAIGGVCPHEFP